MLKLQVRQQQSDLLLEAALRVQEQRLAPEVRAEARRLIKKLLIEYVEAATVERVHE